MAFNLAEQTAASARAQLIHDMLHFESAHHPADDGHAGLHLFSQDTDNNAMLAATLPPPITRQERRALIAHTHQHDLDARVARRSAAVPTSLASIGRARARTRPLLRDRSVPQIHPNPLGSLSARAQARLNAMHAVQGGHALYQHPTEPISPSTTTSPTCAVCFDTIDDKVVLAPCSHSYDLACIESLISAAARDESMFPPSCCGRPIPIELVESDIDPNVVSLYKEKSAEYGTVLRVYCSKKTCSRFLGARNSRDSQTPPEALCCSDECGQSTCNTCLQQVDRGDISAHACSEDESELQIHQLADSKQWATCPGCRSVIELATGCAHVRCRCGTQFCYMCSGKWGTCQCAQLPRRHSQLAHRRPVVRRRSQPYARREQIDDDPYGLSLERSHLHAQVPMSAPPTMLENDFFAAFGRPVDQPRHSSQPDPVHPDVFERELENWVQADMIYRQHRAAPGFIPIDVPGPSGPLPSFYDPTTHRMELPPPGSEWAAPRFDLPQDRTPFTPSHHQPAPVPESPYTHPSLDLSQLMGLQPRHQDEALHLHSPPFPPETGHFNIMW